MKTRGFAAMCRAIGRTLSLTRPLPVVGNTSVAEDNSQVASSAPAYNLSDEPKVDALTPGDVTIVVKGTSGAEFKITGQASDIQKIGDLLRGQPRGWGIRTLAISIGASAATILFSGLIGSQFQFSSWANTVTVDNAKERRNKATDTFNEAINAIGERQTAMRAFVTTLQNLVGSQTTSDRNLLKFNFELDRVRMTNYYDTLKHWNVAYNALLARIDYDLDRQAYLLAGTNPGNPVTYTKTKKVDCSKFITEQMRNVGYEQHSLKAQFAIINYCFYSIATRIEDLKSKALFDTAFTIDNKTMMALNDSLDELNTTANTFQCYSKQRQEFYISQVGSSVIGSAKLFYLSALETVRGHQYVVNYYRAERRPAVLEHFKSSDEHCDPSPA